MKTYKKLSLLFILAFFSASITFAQGNRQDRPQGPPPLPNDEQIEEMVTELSKELSLTENQEEKVSEIYFDHYKEVEALQENSSGNREANRKIMQNLNTELENSVKVLLTEDQKKIYESYLKNQKSKRGRQGGGQGERPQK